VASKQPIIISTQFINVDDHDRTGYQTSTALVNWNSGWFRSGVILRTAVYKLYPSPRPFTTQRGKTCRPRLPIGTLAEGRHTDIQHTWRLDSCSCQEHAHVWVCSALTYSFHGVMPGFIGGMAKRAQLAAYASRDERSPGPQYGLWCRL